MPKLSEEEVKKAIHIILKDEKSHCTSLNYAMNYCYKALALTGEPLRVQCLYILNNIQHWNAEGSKDVRRILKEFSK